MSIDQRAKPRIVIVMEGGLIQSIHADNMPEPAVTRPQIYHGFARCT